jgi:hypothetical protein
MDRCAGFLANRDQIISMRMAEKKQRSTVVTGQMALHLAARQALHQILNPLTEFVIDTGLSTHDMHAILRECAVRIVADRQLQVAKRINVSGISASTGISRSEISRIIKARSRAGGHTDDYRQSTNRILAAWHDEPRYTNSNGQPAELRLYGRGVTFDSLVKVHGRGIPTRAVLDELVRVRVVDVLPSQRIKAKASIVTDRGLTQQFVKAFGDRVSELLSAMLANMREPSTAEFLASVSGTVRSVESLPLIRKDIASKGAEFLSEIQDGFVHHQSGRRTKGGRSMSVTVFCHEHREVDKVAARRGSSRRNFRRLSKVIRR